MVISVSVVVVISKAQASELVVIGNTNVPKMDSAMIQKIYMGKVILIAGINIIPVAAKQGTAQRDRFLQVFLAQDEEKYTGYWTVRRYIGKGTPPLELNNTVEMINYVQSTPGAIGYIDEAELKAGMNVIARK